MADLLLVVDVVLRLPKKVDFDYPLSKRGHLKLVVSVSQMTHLVVKTLGLLSCSLRP